MPKLTEAAIIAVITMAFELRRYRGFVTWKRQATEDVRRHFPGYTPEFIEELAHKHLASGGVIKFVNEWREGLLDDPVHYDFVIADKPKPIYVETVVLRMDIDDPGVEIRSCHPDFG